MGDPLALVVDHARAGGVTITDRQLRMLSSPTGAVDLTQTPTVHATLTRLMAELLDLPATLEVEDAVLGLATSGTIAGELIRELLAAGFDAQPDEPAGQVPVETLPDLDTSPSGTDSQPTAVVPAAADGASARTLLDVLTDAGTLDVHAGPLTLTRPKKVQRSGAAALKPAPGQARRRRRYR